MDYNYRFKNGEPLNLGNNREGDKTFMLWQWKKETYEDQDVPFTLGGDVSMARL